MARFRSTRAPVPLDPRRLEELAVGYVGRYATTRAKLTAYLARKLRERGWDGERQPDLEAMAARFAELGYVDDAAYALAKSQALSNRGYGKRRLEQKLRLAGVAEEDSAAARDHADEAALDAAVRYARRRKIGPFAADAPDPRRREKSVAAMVRAGHPFAIARIIADLPPGADFDIEALRTANPY